MPTSRHARYMALLILTLACRTTDLPTEPSLPPPRPALTTTAGFHWGSATPESQGMCGSTRQLGCTKTLAAVWNGISDPRYNTKRLIVIRNDKVIYDRGGTLAYPAYSASKGLLGAPALVYAMSKCGVGLTGRASQWLGHGDGARWLNDFPWTDITVQHLATHTSGVCDYGNSSTVCRNENAGWQRTFELAKNGGTTYVYPKDAFTIARVRSEQNREPALPPGSVFEYSNVGHFLLNYVTQRACGLSLSSIFDLYIKQSGMGSAVKPALIFTDEDQQFNQSAGVARWYGRDGAAVLRLAGRLGIWDNKNVEPVRIWNVLTRITDNLAAAAAVGWSIVYENNSNDRWTRTTGHKRLSLETFGHGGNYSTVFTNDPLTGTIIVRQGQNNAAGASYLTQNGCAPGWTGTAPTCTAGTDWSNNWNVPAGTEDSPNVGPRKKLFEPLQEAFFFPPPFCRMTIAGGSSVDKETDVYESPSETTSIDLAAEITVNPREGAGSSVADKIQFYEEGEDGVPVSIGFGTPVSGTSPAQFELSYAAESHGGIGEVKTYFANCIAKSTKDGSKKVPSYSRPVRVRRL